MLLSLRRNYLFIHIAKTGGSSVRAALARDRWLDPWHWPYAICSRISHWSRHRLPVKLPRHAPAMTAREMLSPEAFDRLFKFAWVRNPWDRLVSAHGHLMREGPQILRTARVQTFGEFVDWAVNEASHYRGDGATLIRSLCRPQAEYVVDLNGNLLVDFVGRFEFLLSSFQHVARRINLPGRQLPHKRDSKRPVLYSEFYSDATREAVAEFYRQDLALFGYRFDERAVGQVDDWPSLTAESAPTKCA
jgi:hypothetical protein